MAANIAEVKNVFKISDSKIYVSKKSTISVQTLLFDSMCVLTPSL